MIEQETNTGQREGCEKRPPEMTAYIGGLVRRFAQIEPSTIRRDGPSEITESLPNLDEVFSTLGRVVWKELPKLNLSMGQADHEDGEEPVLWVGRLIPNGQLTICCMDLETRQHLMTIGYFPPPINHQDPAEILWIEWKAAELTAVYEPPVN